jgi:hypothetical protein
MFMENLFFKKTAKWVAEFHGALEGIPISSNVGFVWVATLTLRRAALSAPN